MLRTVLASAALAFVASACAPGSVPSLPQSTKANIGITQGQIDTGAVERLLARVEQVRNVDGRRGEIGMDEILSFLPATEGERNAVLAAHPNPVPVTCDDNYCTAVSQGSEVYVTLSQMNNMQSWFSSTVNLVMRWRGTSQLELCRIGGFQVKQVFWLNVDGVYIDAQGGDGSSFVDVGFGGSYPSC